MKESRHSLIFLSPVSCSAEWGWLFLHHGVDLGQLHTKAPHTVSARETLVPSSFPTSMLALPWERERMDFLCSLSVGQPEDQETQAHVERLACWLARWMVNSSVKQGVGRKQYWPQILGQDHPDLSCRQTTRFLSPSKLLPQTFPALSENPRLFLHGPLSPSAFLPPPPASLNIGPREREIMVSSFEMTKFSSPRGTKTDLRSSRTSSLSYLRDTVSATATSVG